MASGPKHYAAAEAELHRLRTVSDTSQAIGRTGTVLGHALLAVAAAIIDTSLDPAYEEQWTEVKR